MPKRKPKEPVQREVQEMPEEILGVPRRLKEAMDDEGLNATQLSEIAGVSTQVITRILRGERLKGMRAGSAVLLCRALGRNLDWLLAEIGPEKRFAVTDGADAEAIVRATLKSLGYETSGAQGAKNKLPAATENTK